MKAAFYTPTPFEPSKRASDGLKIGCAGLGIETIEAVFADSIPDDVDFIVTFGWRKRLLDTMPMWAFNRNPRIDEAKRRGVPVLCVERGCMLDRSEWHLLGWNGLNGRSQWINGWYGGERWRDVFSKRIEVKPWIQREGPIVIVGQVLRDASLDSCANYQQWIADVINELEKFTDQIIFRPHPRGTKIAAGLPIDPNRDFSATLKTASGTVAWNSTCGVESVIAGVPHYAADQGSMARWVSQPSLEVLVRFPIHFQRQPWLERIAWAQWNDEECRSGAPLRHLLPIMGMNPCSSVS